MSSLRVILALVSIVVLLPRHLPAQASGTVISGTVRSEAGVPLASAVVTSGGRMTTTDSLGHFELAGLSGDSARVHIRRIGSPSVDTAIALRPGKRVQLDVRLESYDWDGERRKAEVANAANGRVDSSARGLLRPSAPAALPSLTFNAFGARFLAAALADAGADENVVLSPASAGLALGLALQGARRSTEAALARLLGTDTLDRAAVVQRGASFIAAASGRSDVQLEIANAVWVDSVAVLTRSFGASAAAWQARVATLRLNSQRAVDVINAWADSVTHGKITRVLNDSLPDTTALVIANAVYFKGKWLDPFEKSATVPRDFTLASGARVRVPSMTRTGRLAYRRDSDFQVVRLPYRGGRAALYVILPDSGISAGELTRRFAEGPRPASLIERDMREVHLELPKLRVEQSVDLLPLLGALGAGVALDCDVADFGDMAVSRARGTPLRLCIGKAVQKVYLDMDEEGTEAAAVTALGMSFATAAPKPLEFIVNRPFLFILRDEVTGADLFVGRIARP